MPVESVRSYHARVAGLTRAIKAGERPADSPELDNAKRDLNAARIAAFIERQLAQAPPLTQAQRDQLAELLKPVRRGGGDDAA
ncbi:hypothetical protein [Mycobacterium sp. URHD0025]|uniref:hypothetical protein n=1 Tax=Mycobacterium sp. URHD0025 TaxID=1298864 RepID=UPI0004072B3C|nr:hypothetical protein [Mycobacterium sp. URHD0025]